MALSAQTLSRRRLLGIGHVVFGVEHQVGAQAQAQRQRDLALSIPPGPGRTPNELALITVDLAKQYAHLSPRTMMRDLEVLQGMELIVESGGKYRINFALLTPHIAQRRRRDQPNIVGL